LHSVQDIITDLNAESEILPLEPVNEDWKGHKVSKKAFLPQGEQRSYCHKVSTEALATR
jgi:hypothetical protein